jgi:hypothetical protein
LNSDLEDQFSRPDFPGIFQRQVVDKLSVKFLAIEGTERKPLHVTSSAEAL